MVWINQVKLEKAMKFLLIFLLSCNFLYAQTAKEELQEVSKKVEKRKDYCSPLDKMMKKCEAKDGETDKKIVNKAHKKTKEVSKKVEKREDYCSPLDKMMKKCGKKK
tara:strand:+ start:69470 stop:69790 length:321 start_codon:yes stop_codon:yes gene_type:complete